MILLHRDGIVVREKQKERKTEREREREREVGEGEERGGEGWRGESQSQYVSTVPALYTQAEAILSCCDSIAVSERKN